MKRRTYLCMVFASVNLKLLVAQERRQYQKNKAKSSIVRMYVCAHQRAPICVCVCVYKIICVSIGMCVYIHTYINT